MATTYRDIEEGRITVSMSELTNDEGEMVPHYSWKRETIEDNPDAGKVPGIQVDGSGPLRNSTTDLKALVKDLRERFPDDEIFAPEVDDG